MKRRKPLRSFSVFAFLGLLALASCQTQSNQTTAPDPASELVVSSLPPFETREPERYRAIRIITTITANGATHVTKNWIAKDGQMRRDESEAASQRVVYLYLPDATFVLLPKEKLFAGIPEDTTSGEDEDSETSPDRLLHSDPVSTSYQKLEREAIGGRNLQKYRVVVNSSAGANVSVSETLIWIDETLRLPVKSETSSADGTRTTAELTEITLEADKALFQIPDDYQRIDFAGLRKRIRNGAQSQP